MKVKGEWESVCVYTEGVDTTRLRRDTRENEMGTTELIHRQD